MSTGRTWSGRPAHGKQRKIATMCTTDYSSFFGQPYRIDSAKEKHKTEATNVKRMTLMLGKLTGTEEQATQECAQAPLVTHARGDCTTIRTPLRLALSHTMLNASRNLSNAAIRAIVP